METSQQVPLRAVLVDDERLARENLELLLEEFCPEVEVVGKAGGVEEGLRVIDETTPDVLFLDIRMPSGAEGFDLLAQLPNRNFQVVFVTAFKDYAIRAMNASAVHYVLKPIDIEDLQHAVQKLVDVHQALTTSAPSRAQYAASLDELQHTIRTQGKPQRLTLYHNRGFRMVDVANIVRLEAADSCTEFHFADGSTYLDTKTLRVYEDLLRDQQFVRIHKSHLVHLVHLKEYINQDGHFVRMTDGSEVPVARAKLSWFLSMVRGL